MNITVVMTGDEEDAGEPLSARARRWSTAAKGAAVAIGFEDGDGDPTHAVIARRGTTGCGSSTVRARRPLVADLRPDLGCGAIFEAARILNAFREQAGRRAASDVQSRA